MIEEQPKDIFQILEQDGKISDAKPKWFAEEADDWEATFKKIIGFLKGNRSARTGALDSTFINLLHRYDQSAYILFERMRTPWEEIPKHAIENVLKEMNTLDKILKELGEP